MIARKRTSSSGFALITVLWFAGVLALLMAGLMSNARSDLEMARHAIENAKARVLADSGVQRAIFDLLVNKDSRQMPDKLDYAFTLGEDQIRVSIADEDGKIDLNAAPLPMIRGLLMALGLQEQLAATLSDRIGDFRDRDHDPEPFGAEDAHYEKAGLASGAADRAFETTDELLHVLGMTGGVFNRMRPYVTVYSSAPGIDPMRAQPTVLRAVPGLTDDTIEQLRRPSSGGNPLLRLPRNVLLAVQDYLTPSRSSTFSIRSVGESKEGGRFIRDAVIKLSNKKDDSRYNFQQWRKGYAQNDGG